MPIPAGTAVLEISDEPVDTPVYRRIVDGIAAGIAAGQLHPGDRLPTHRSLAHKLGVAVPTISRAYREAERRGLINSTVGRGTFITGIPTLRNTVAPVDVGGRVDLAVNSPARGEHEPMLRAALAAAANDPAVAALLAYDSDIGGEVDRAAAAGWIARSGITVDTDQVVICHGGQHAILVALGAVLRPGAVLLTEELTYPGVKSAAQLLGITVTGVDMDEHGIIPAALETACGAGPVRPVALYCMPNAHNPTAITLLEDRRREIAKIARRFDLQIIEDDVFGLLADTDDQLPALVILAPERTLYLTSLSKTLTPGLRWGAIAAPTEMVDRLGGLVRASIFNPAPIAADITRRWLDDGTADRLLQWQRTEIRRRFDVVLPILTACSAVQAVRMAGLHVWVDLTEPWTPSEITDAADTLDIDVSPTSYFHADARTATHPFARGVRLSVGGVADTRALVEAITRLAHTLNRGPTWSSGTRV